MPDASTDTIARDAAGVLGPGEELGAAAVITRIDPGATGPVDARAELGAAATRVLTLGLLGGHTQLLRLAGFGRAVDGPAGSTAATLHELITEASWAKLVVTDRRVIVARGELVEHQRQAPGHYEFSVVGWVARTAVTGARPAPRGLLRRGRIVVSCADGSAVAVNLLRRQSSTVLAALGGQPNTRTSDGRTRDDRHDQG
ncbi:hypothetical protein [Hamadaea tsunoensis]|uniref:hypothetical protein n=1 Tax=Hamadaea tsunoensis TaxID=53368 RepID=UPI0004220C97|nr:hypothetical protein [Hamadaea tsunoensis]